VVEQVARALRRDLTPAERRLWSALRGHQLSGIGFRRQHPVGRFILDFCAPSHRLAIEVDGPVHDAQRERDAERTAVLRAHGYRVLRLRNEEIVGDMPAVLARIREAALGL
jgi:very-short-patch-repair endonuclease